MPGPRTASSVSDPIIYFHELATSRCQGRGRSPAKHRSLQMAVENASEVFKKSDSLVCESFPGAAACSVVGKAVNGWEVEWAVQ